MDERDQLDRLVSLCGQPQIAGPEYAEILAYHMSIGLKFGQFTDRMCPACVRLYKAKHWKELAQ